jgi:hypothetical protein
MTGPPSDEPYAALVDSALDAPVYGLARDRKAPLVLAAQNALTRHHFAACREYRQVLHASGADEPPHAAAIDDLPFLHVGLFKDFRLTSIPDSAIARELTSSGTTGQRVSRIYLDAATARRQTVALVRTLQSFLGKSRLPMLIVDQERTIADRTSYSARGAGILGLSNFGRDHTYALDDAMRIDAGRLDAFLQRHAGERILVFGFTFVVWRHFVQALRSGNRTLHLPGSILVHAGGWKKLQDEAVDNAMLRRAIGDTLGIAHVHDYYGMVEQTGAVHVECEHGHLHTPAFADVIVRDPVTWLPLPAGAPGMLQVLSLLPWSYPGHSILTEDMGVLLGEDDCACGRLGKHFRVLGRVPRVEVRGCSDTRVEAAA